MTKCLIWIANREIRNFIKIYLLYSKKYSTFATDTNYKDKQQN